MLPGSAGPYETMLGSLVSFDFGVFERGPIGLAIAIPRDEAMAQFLERRIGNILRTRMTRGRRRLSLERGRAARIVARSALAALVKGNSILTG